MPSDLAQHITETPLVDTHNELKKEADWVERGPDILKELFDFVTVDLHVSGADPKAMRRLRNSSDPDIAGRFRGIQDAWEVARFTGYGEAARLIASEFYGLDELTPEGLAEAQTRLPELRKPGARYDVLRNRANIDHVQTDDKCWVCAPDESGPDFFLYDISWSDFCNGVIQTEQLEAETGIVVRDLPSLNDAMEALFDRYAGCAIAVKSTHIFRRPFTWTARETGDAGRALDAVLRKGSDVDEETRLCLGDWCWARGIILATRHDLPFKMHTGYFAGTGGMQINRVKAGHLCPLLAHFPDARFVLMHMSYPFEDELVALCKHYCNVWADLCWAWTLNPYASRDFVRRFLHSAPISKLFAFGGDAYWPTMGAAHAIQARKWLTKALQAEVDDGELTEKQAMFVADRVMYKNQYECFDVEGTRSAIRAALKRR